ncbi:RNA polymerase sigma factor [Synoicihabitans lomoniglobus]|uniref:Sigma-70 family RNA polymerase sigma factor n=1 Tax=Synoicihabitans lomoniglobus TaxID=2909285 RepID=A0AAF0I364_9BACT|nr:sigma-70 family RNA polymerase sigma factor [Opitutaceae bacterium LMO-M01]WED65939.1 sigma-70 family RNA polymerase sigma factor [Opitutaceae bacterium LMO-M01]
MKRDARQILTELLVLNAQGGDAAAFGQLHDLWQADLKRLAVGRVERADAAAEVAQDAWVTIARSLRRLDDPACFPRWAFRILERRCADWIRRRQTERRHAAELAAIGETNTAPSVLPPPSEEVLVLREAITQLEGDARHLLKLFYETGLSVNEIAEVLGVPVGTVKSRLFHTREALKRQLERMKS